MNEFCQQTARYTEDTGSNFSVDMMSKNCLM